MSFSEWLFVVVVVLIVMHNKKEEILCFVFSFCNCDKASNCHDPKGLIFVLNLPVAEVFWITSDYLILVCYVKEVLLCSDKRLIWFFLIFKESLRNINQPFHLWAPEGVTELIWILWNHGKEFWVVPTTWK